MGNWSCSMSHMLPGHVIAKHHPVLPVTQAAVDGGIDGEADRPHRAVAEGHIAAAGVGTTENLRIIDAEIPFGRPYRPQIDIPVFTARRTLIVAVVVGSSRS